MFHDPEKIFSPWIKKGDVVLDIGCGPGYFTIPLAKMVGENGKVIAVDIQDRMIEKLKRNLEKNNLRNRVNIIKARKDDILVNQKVDFVLSFWMVHEVGNPDLLFKQVMKTLKPGAYYAVVEPKFHVIQSRYNRIIKAAESCGLKQVSTLDVRFSRGTLFTL